MATKRIFKRLSLAVAGLAMGFGSGSGDGTRTIYNFQIADFTNSGVDLSFDNIYLF